MIRNEKYNTVNQLPFFKNFDKTSLLGILDYIEINNFRKGKYLFYQGDKANFAFYQINGLVKEEKLCGNNNIIIGNFTIDKWYGLEEVFLDTEYFHDAYILRESLLVSITKYNLNKIIEISEIKDNFFKEILKNYKIVENKLNFDTPGMKIAKYLLSFSNNPNQYEIKVTQDQLSELLNFTRETINKHLKKMENNNIIKLARGNITIKNQEELKKFIE